ncbi:MAG: hypothetical protein DI537_41290, partial [Stutzerimonas stutzeri]|jgi:hypothetical protein
MNQDSDEAYFARRAQQELDLAGRAADAATKTIHLDLAATYATRRELAARANTDGNSGSGTRST